MISTAFVYFASFLISALLLVVSPLGGDAGFPSETQTYINLLVGYVGKADVFIPLDTLFWAISFIVAFEIIVLLFKMAKWLFSYVPFIGRS